LIVDLGSPQTISGFVYLPRQEGENGRIAGYEFYLSENGSTWVTAATGTFSDSTAAQTVLFE
jgi:endo-alpha-N-acetylgalactosaminidase